MRVITPATLLVALADVACVDTPAHESDSVQDVPAAFAQVRRRHGNPGGQVQETPRARNVLGPARMWNIGLHSFTVRVDLRLFVRRENARRAIERWSYTRMVEVRNGGTGE
jgi:hypothetical protein